MRYFSNKITVKEVLNGLMAFMNPNKESKVLQRHMQKNKPVLMNFDR